VTCSRACVCCVGQVYIPVGLVIDLDIHDTIGYEGKLVHCGYEGKLVHCSYS
jgi:hypothetical protein